MCNQCSNAPAGSVYEVYDVYVYGPGTEERTRRDETSLARKHAACIALPYPSFTSFLLLYFSQSARAAANSAAGDPASNRAPRHAAASPETEPTARQQGFECLYLCLCLCLCEPVTL